MIFFYTAKVHGDIMKESLLWLCVDCCRILQQSQYCALCRCIISSDRSMRLRSCHPRYQNRVLSLIFGKVESVLSANSFKACARLFAWLCLFFSVGVTGQKAPSTKISSKHLLPTILEASCILLTLSIL